jgi:hypothetical protein
MVVRRAFLILAGVVLAGAALAEPQRPRAVIELFTSQGCSSCPPADRLLGEYARDPTLIALTYPVQIWDYLGWRDTLATPENTRRQKGYARARADRQVYTPQVVVNGAFHVVGSDRVQIDERCNRSAGTAAFPLAVTLDRVGDRLTVSTNGTVPVGDTRLILAVVERERTIPVTSGENRGASITYHNVVRELRDLGPWTGSETREMPWPAGSNTVAVMVQSWSTGMGPTTILGAALLR